jgi:hypothetical protein
MVGTPRDIAYLEDRFQTGDVPTQQDFYDLFVSFLHHSKVKQETGEGTSDVMSQKAVSDALANLAGVKTAVFQNTKLPVLAMYQDVRTQTKDYLDQHHFGSPQSWGGNIRKNEISAAIIDEPTSGASYLALQDLNNNAGIQIDDQVLFISEVYSSSSGNYTGDVIPSATIFDMFYKDGLLYYSVSDNSLWIFDTINLINTRKQFAGASSLRHIRYDAINDRIVLVGVSAVVRYDIVTQAHVIYTRTSGNYTGDLLPSNNISDAAIINDVLWLVRSAGIITAENGLYRFDLSGQVITKHTTTNGLVENRINQVVANGVHLYIRYGTVTSTPLARINTDDFTIVHYGNETNNYSGDRIPVAVLGQVEIDVNNQILIINAPSSILIFKIDGSFNLSLSEHSLIMGYSISIPIDGLQYKSSTVDVDGRVILHFTKASSSDTGVGVQSIKLWEDQNPVKVTFNEMGLNYQVLDNKALTGLNTVVSKFILDQVASDLRLRDDFLDKEKDNNMVPVENGQIYIYTTKSAYNTYIYSGVPNISFGLQMNMESMNRITIVQMGEGQITLTDGGGVYPIVGGKLITNGQFDSIELIRISDGSPEGFQFIGR